MLSYRIPLVLIVATSRANFERLQPNVQLVNIPADCQDVSMPQTEISNKESRTSTHTPMCKHYKCKMDQQQAIGCSKEDMTRLFPHGFQELGRFLGESSHMQVNSSCSTRHIPPRSLPIHQHMHSSKNVENTSHSLAETSEPLSP